MSVMIKSTLARPRVCATTRPSYGRFLASHADRRATDYGGFLIASEGINYISFIPKSCSFRAIAMLATDGFERTSETEEVPAVLRIPRYELEVEVGNGKKEGKYEEDRGDL